MANFWLNVLSEMESLTSDGDHTVLSLTRAVDLDFGEKRILVKINRACIKSVVSFELFKHDEKLQLINPLPAR